MLISRSPQIVLIDAKPSVRKQILRELQIMHDCHSDYIISFYGAFLSDPNICICMEFMDKGSFDSIYKSMALRSGMKSTQAGNPGDTSGPIPIGIVRQAAKRVLGGLMYLYEEMGVLHRDIKPSNLLLNSEGEYLSLQLLSIRSMNLHLDQARLRYATSGLAEN